MKDVKTPDGSIITNYWFPEGNERPYIGIKESKSAEEVKYYLDQGKGDYKKSQERTYYAGGLV